MNIGCCSVAIDRYASGRALNATSERRNEMRKHSVLSLLLCIGIAIQSLVLAAPVMAQEATAKNKMRIALAGLFEEVNTFADETMGKAKITGNMTTGFQQWTDKAIIAEYKGSKTYMVSDARRVVTWKYSPILKAAVNKA
jgi:hypothetical protein